MVTDLIRFISENLGLSIILGFLLIFILIPITLDLIDQKRMKNPVEITQEKINSLQCYVTGTDGPVGYGKTTLLSALTHFIVIKLQNKMDDTINEFRSLNWKIDYNWLDLHIRQAMEDGYNTFDIEEIIKYKYGYAFMKKHDLGVERKTALDMLDSYVSAYIHSIKGITILSNSEFKCKLTGKLSKCYSSDMVYMKERWTNSDWVIDDYTIIIDDDANMDTFSSALNFQKYAKADTGGPLFRRLIRQMYQGTVYLLSSSQSIKRIVLEERELIPCQIRNEKHCYVCCDFWRTQKIITRFIIKPLNKIEHVYLLFKYGKKNIEKAVKKPNRFKKLIYKFTIFQYKLYSKGFVVYPTILDYGSDLVENEEFDFVVPVQFAFGALNSENFRYFQEIMVKNSTKRIEDVLDNDGSEEVHNQIFMKIIKRNSTEAGAVSVF